MNQLVTLLKKESIGLYRTKKILIIGIVFLFFAILSPITAYLAPYFIELLAQYDQNVVIIIPEPTYIDSYYQFISNFSQTCTLILIIVLAPLIVDEKRKGTFHTLLNNKVSKTNFILSKVITQIKVFTLFYLLSIVIFLIYTSILFESVFAPNWFLVFLSLYLYYIFLISLINLMSVIAKSNVMSIVLSFVAFFAIMLFNFIPIMGKYLPNYLLTITNKIMVDNNYLQYININFIVTILLFIGVIFLSIRLCYYEG
jgi:ABC-2 type transport system permease protein